MARPGGWDSSNAKVTWLPTGSRLKCSIRAWAWACTASKTRDARGLFRAYNDWIIEYCQKVPDRLFGIALISMYNVDHAIAEMERCKKQGIVGTMIWQVPHRNFPFTSDHYERFWAASQDLDLPVHLHILTGFGDSMHRQTTHGIKRFRIGLQQTREIENALFEMIFHGVLERYPKLKIVSVENEWAGCRSGWTSAIKASNAIATRKKSR